LPIGYKVENWVCEVPFQHHGQPGHRLITRNFANAVLSGEALMAPTVEPEFMALTAGLEVTTAGCWRRAPAWAGCAG
jgi:hypothetical protein